MNTIARFIRSLKDSPAGNVFNPWIDVDPDCDRSRRAPAQRRENLEAYLSARLNKARWLLIAEAAGFRGAKFSGVAMTCERQLVGGMFPHPRTSRDDIPLSTTDRILGVLEPTAMIVGRALTQSMLDPADVVLWNTFAWHPHKPGNRLTNRTPSNSEVNAGLTALRSIIDLFPNTRVIAIGKTSQRTLLETLGMQVPAVRHPANGGATKFTQGVISLSKTDAKPIGNGATRVDPCVAGGAGR